MRRRHLLLAIGLFAAAGGALLLVRQLHRGVLQDAVRQQVVATIQREARASLLVTGTLDVTATITHQSTRTLLPGIVDLPLGTSRAIVQVPGRAYYGIDIRTFTADDISIRGDTVTLRVPRPHVISAEPNLAGLRTWTNKGWLRTPASVQQAQEAALRGVNDALLRQATSYLATSSQPGINTAHALRLMLRPPLVALGMKQPHFRFEMGERLVLE